jgi:hypothetical protein
MPNLHSKLNELAHNFASAVLEAMRGASLEDLQAAGDRVGNGRSLARAAAPQPAAAPKRRSSGRLPRRSPEDIAKVLDGVVALVKKHREGLRAEQIREELGLQAKEMPRVLKEGLSKRVLRSKGQKRATTYFAK